VLTRHGLVHPLPSAGDRSAFRCKNYVGQVAKPTKTRASCQPAKTRAGQRSAPHFCNRLLINCASVPFTETFIIAVAIEEIERAARAAQRLARQVQVTDRRGDRGVAEQDLNGAQIDTRFQQMGGEAMPEQVHAAALADAGPGLGFVENLTSGVVMKRRTRVAPGKQQTDGVASRPPFVRARRPWKNPRSR